MTTCQEILAELENYLEDGAAADLRGQIQGHLAECRTCEVIYDSARKTVRIVTESRSFELPERVSQRVVDRILTRVRDLAKE